MRAIHWSTAAALAASLLALASCSGGGGGSVQSGSPAVLPAAGSSAASGAQFTVSVARQTPQSANRKAASVSAGIASLVISATGTANASTTINVAAGGPGCTTTPTSISCTGTINLVPGTYTFAVKEYDGPSGTGNVLGTGTVSQTLAPGALTNVALTLNGIVTTVQLALNPTTLPSGTATTATLTVMALDASGNVIVGPGVYVDANGNPLTIAVTTSGAGGITLSAAQVTSSANAALKVSYSGTALTAGTQALFNASATGIAAAKTVALTFSAAGTSAGSLYVVNNGFLQQYSADGNTLIAQLLSPGNPRAIGYDGVGNLYLVAGASILVYPPGAGTSGTPLRTIGGTKFTNCFVCYGSVTVDSHGEVYNIELAAGNTTVGAFSPTASGNVAQDKTWTISTINDQVSAVAADTDGSVYVASVNSNCCAAYTEIDVFPSSTPSGAVSPPRSIVLPSNTYTAVVALGFDAAHNMYAFDNSSNSIVEIPAGTSGPYTPSTAFTDSIGSFNEIGFAVEPNGAVDVAYQSPQSHVDHYPAGSTGTVTPPILGPGVNGFTYAYGLALSPTGNLSVFDAYNSGIYTYGPAAVAAGGNPAAASFAAGVPFGVGNLTSAMLAPNGDLVVAGSGGPDAIDVYSAGTLALGTPVRSISSLNFGNAGAAFEDANGYLYATIVGMAGFGGDAIARRPGAAAKRIPGSAKRQPAGFTVNQNQVAVFAPGASGQALPVRTITTPAVYITAATAGPDGTLYIAVPGGVLVYAPAASNPTTTIANPGTSTFHAITVDASGWIYITDGTTIYTIAPGTSTIHGSFPITSPGANNALLTANASNLYVAVAAGLESYPLGAVRLVGIGGTAPALNPGVLPVYDPAQSNPSLYTAVFGN